MQNQLIGRNPVLTPTSDKIPENGTKSPDISKAAFSNKNYTIAPISNKQAYGVISKNEIQSMGKK